MDSASLKQARELMQSMRALCGQERLALCDFLRGLTEIEAGQIHLELGFPNMFELCRVEFGLSEGCIYRRLQVSRKIKYYPELLIALREGQINLTLASLLCPYLGKFAWSELLSRVAGQSKRQAQKALRDLAEFDTTALATVRIQYLGREHYSYKLKIPAELHHQFERVRELLSHQIPDGDIHAILSVLTQTYLKKNDPQSKVAASPDLWQHYASPTRYIPKGLKHLIFEKAENCCQYISPEGRRCTQKRYLDIDHIMPLSAGGQTKLDNLQVLCHAHNLLKSDQLPHQPTNHNQSDPPSRSLAPPIQPRQTLKLRWREDKENGETATRGRDHVPASSRSQ